LFIHPQKQEPVKMSRTQQVERLYSRASQKKSNTKTMSSASPPQADQWAINESRHDPNTRFIVARTGVNGITYYDAPPADAPVHVKQRFADLVATDAQAFADRSDFLNKQNNHKEPATPGIASVVDIARALIRGKR
jgi:hypothetical protein